MILWDSTQILGYFNYRQGRTFGGNNERKKAMAESEGFEPPDLLQSTVFKTAAFDRSASSPIYCLTNPPVVMPDRGDYTEGAQVKPFPV